MAPTCKASGRLLVVAGSQLGAHQCCPSSLCPCLTMRCSPLFASVKFARNDLIGYFGKRLLTKVSPLLGNADGPISQHDSQRLSRAVVKGAPPPRHGKNHS